LVNVDSLQGQQLGNHVIRRLRGRGGMGAVYEAEHVVIGSRAAIKVLHPEVSQDASMVQRFFNEAKASAAIGHPGVVKIFDVGFTADRRAYIVMELLAGEAMRTRMRRLGRMRMEHAAALIAQAASAIQAAHERGIIHRDLKPENLFITPAPDVGFNMERVVVLDFGVAKLTGTLAGEAATQTGAVLGTPLYMAPEQWKDATRVDARSDVYALGCVLYELLGGRPPFTVLSLGELATAHLYDTPTSIAELRPGLPAALVELLARCLAKEPDERPAAARDLAQALEALAGRPATAVDALPGEATEPMPIVARAANLVPPGSLAAPTPAAEITPLVGPVPTRRSLTWLAAVALFTVIAAVAVVVILRPAPPPPPAAAPRVVASPAPREPSPSRPASWVRIVPPAVPVTLGIDSDAAGDDVLGFRPARHIMSPSVAYDLQRTEVTWAAFEVWARAHAVDLATLVPPAVDPGAAVRAHWPATGIPWALAHDYCRDLGGSLPTEEQWEYAARGPRLRPHPWGDRPIDPARTRAWAGTPSAVGTSDQDITPEGIVDLAGNAQEWTIDLYREDRPGLDERWVREGGRTYRPVRGLPLGEPEPGVLPRSSASFRQALCAGGDCPKSTARVLRGVGFRCVKPAS
jgi:formylglycine-generating enzyme required for sulfatase activity/tRNA A-37 threonylcarbamoyl transferase component Bud32